ncbi:MAG: MerR family transcriptional regulator [Actinomycetota bacterium]|nr:MerR family transcriptional regulator [Actinomycetota bacterium]
MEQLVPIGRFSALTRLSAKALRRYDELGLLRPAEVDPSSGYRYYRLAQANEARAIRLLRSADLGLGDIGEILASDDPDVVAKVLDRHRARLEHQLAEQQRRIELVERLLRDEEPIVPYTVEVRELGPVDVVGLRTNATMETVADAVGHGFGAVMEALGAAGRQPVGPPFLVLWDVIDEETSGDIEMCIPVDGLPDDLDEAAEVRGRIVAPGPAATTIHRGSYEDVAPAYHVLAAWMQSHGHEPAGPPREVYLDDPTEVAPLDRRTEIQWPIVADHG